MGLSTLKYSVCYQNFSPTGLSKKHTIGTSIKWGALFKFHFGLGEF